MVEVTRLNGTKVMINADMIESVESTPDTVVSLATGYKIIVKESRQDIRNLVILYKREIFSGYRELGDFPDTTDRGEKTLITDAKVE